ncbi:MAG: protein kinase [Acidimicrobiaceae bacterium]|nr:protein kinase [Acidimicrobiaceae bacterium]
MAVPDIDGFGELIEIGRGGFSRVYRAREFEFDRLVAVKVLNDPIRDGATAAAFERECRTMGRLLHHPNIVTVIKSAYTAENQPCIVMELYHAGSYRHLLRQPGQVDVGELLSMGVKIAGALSTAHAATVLHGDVKPGNVFRSKFGEPALGDFGIASFARSRAGQTARGFSVHYAPPDLIDGTPSVSSDQYSLAATLFTLALGRRPFEASESDAGDAAGDANEQVLMRVLKAPVPRLPQQFPAALTEALWRAMSKDPDSRFDDLAEFAARLNAAEAELGFSPTAMPFDVVRDDAGALGGDDSFDAYASGLGVAGVVVLSGGRIEPVDADLVIGRRPGTQPLKAHQRGVVHGRDDRTVSRRQLELRARGREVIAVNVGARAAVMAADGTTLHLATGDSWGLHRGDTLVYGTDQWLRFEAAGASAGAPIGALSRRDAAQRGLAAEIRFSDGRVERLDADLVIGRAPRNEPLALGQRAVVQGESDRRVSRRHIVLRSHAGQLVAEVVGREAVVQRSDGTVHELRASTEHLLDPGDILHYGSACWLRYEGSVGT